MIEKDRIVYLISKQFAGKLSSTEDRELQEWLSRYPALRKLCKEFKDLKIVGKKVNRFMNSEIPNAWQKVRDLMQDKDKSSQIKGVSEDE